MTQSRHSGTSVHLARSSHPPIALVSASLSSPPAPRCSGEAALAGSAWARRLFHPATGRTQNGIILEIQRGFGVSVPCQPPMEWASLPLLHPCRGAAKDGSQDAPQESGPPPPWWPPKAGLLSQFRLSRRFPPPLVPPSPGSPHLCPRPSPPLRPGGPAASCAPRASGRERGDEAPGAAPPPSPLCRGQGTGPSPSASSPHTSDVHFQLKLDTNFLSG